MPRQSAGICRRVSLCFQGRSRAAARARSRPRLAFDLGFAQFPGQPLVAYLAVLTLEEGQQIGADGAPLPARQARHARQLGIVVGQPAACVPHRHQQQHVGADLLGGELQGVTDEIGDVELHEGPLAHAGPRAAPASEPSPMEPERTLGVMRRRETRETCL